MVVFTNALMNQGWGVVQGLVTIGALVALALTFRDLVLLGVAAIATIRRRGQSAPGEEPRWATGTRRAGALVAAAIVAAVASIVLLVGLG